MARKILVIGSPGTGKSTSIENLDPKTTFVICADRKGLPLKGWKNNYKTIKKENGKLDLENTNYYETADTSVIISLLKAISSSKPETKVIVIDTITAVMENEYISRIKEKGYEKFSDIALDTFSLLTAPEELNLREDLTVVIFAHSEDNYDSNQVLRTSFKVVGGKLIGQNIIPEARFNNVLYTEVRMEDNTPKYYFLTQNNGSNTCRTLKDLFTELRIPNDLNYVIQTIEDYENAN